MNIRNFCIIAHIDHGKSTLADRLLERTGTIAAREMKDQLLDQMDLERERGITIKLQPVRMDYQFEGKDYILNLIDTPGHVDFSYEVSRSLAAVEGAVLLVDATQGIQAQTLANLYLALELNLTIIPAVNKIDLPGARIDEVTDEIVSLLGCNPEDVARVSGKTGEGVEDLLERIISKVPYPHRSNGELSRALIFDSMYDEYRGVVAYVRLFDGSLARNQVVRFKATGAETQILETGYFRPKFFPSEGVYEGEIGYIVTGLKSVNDCRVGDTIVLSSQKLVPALAGYKEVKPMVFAGLFPREGDEFKQLRDAVEKLKANDAAFTFESEHSPALGFGFRCGFLGLLHLEIVQERLKREYGLEIIVTVPSVAYKIRNVKGHESIIHSPLQLPNETVAIHIEEPWIRADIVAPDSCIGAIMGLTAEKRGLYKNTEYLTAETASGQRRVVMHFELPLSSILVDFYDKLKSVSAGYASLNYELLDYRVVDVVRMDISVADECVDALASIVYRDQAYYVGRKIVEALKKSLPRQQFEIKIQASIGSKVIAAERISALRKDVTVGLYGGDVTRKQKLLKKQKEGKKRMRSSGHVDIPTDTYLQILKR
ncbi:MAG: translation elongation factor 4 [bacterium]|nr:translation elongation factor 4 [bacterium]